MQCHRGAQTARHTVVSQSFLSVYSRLVELCLTVIVRRRTDLAIVGIYCEYPRPSFVWLEVKQRFSASSLFTKDVLIRRLWKEWRRAPSSFAKVSLTCFYASPKTCEAREVCWKFNGCTNNDSRGWAFSKFAPVFRVERWGESAFLERLGIKMCKVHVIYLATRRWNTVRLEKHNVTLIVVI